MFKKFIKKIGKGIKKIGKAIGKPFKKLMKTKLGKIIGTIGMMMIGGWMLGGAKAFIGGMWSGQGVGSAFSSAMSNMGTAVSKSFSTITEGVTNMFGGEANAANNASKVANNIETVVETGADKIVDPSVVKDLEIQPDTSKVVTDVVTGEQSIVKDKLKLVKPSDISSEKWKTLTPIEQKELVNLSTPGFNVKTGEMGVIPEGYTRGVPSPETIGIDAELTGGDVFKYETIAPETTLKVKGTAPKFDAKTGITTGGTFGQEFVPKEKSLLSKIWDYDWEQIKEKTYGYQPFKKIESLPGIIRKGTVGEGVTLAKALQKPEEQYQQGRSDMTGAYEALEANVERLYTGPTPSMTQLGDGRTSIPSPSVVGAVDYLNNSRKAGFIWDTSLLAIKSPFPV